MARRTVVTVASGPDGPVVSTVERDVAVRRGDACPFHGLVGNERFRIAAGGPAGNACALEMGHVPCRMEMGGAPPDWNRCAAWNVPAREAVVGHVVETFTVLVEGGPPEGTPMAEWIAGAPVRDR